MLQVHLGCYIVCLNQLLNHSIFLKDLRAYGEQYLETDMWVAGELSAPEVLLN